MVEVQVRYIVDDVDVAIEVEDLATTVDGLRKAGPRSRHAIVTGVGGKQIFQPTWQEARLEKHQ